MSDKLFILGQYLLPQILLTRFAGWMASRTSPWLKNKLINDFIKRYQVDMSIAVMDKAEDYVHFNDFFTRALKPEARPIAADSNILVCPADGCVSQVGQLDKNTLLQAKGSYYTVEQLLGNQPEAAAFIDGSFATFYLSPKDYHRVHIPFAGKLIRTIYVPGKLFSVNALATKKIPQLFARNERLVCLFETAVGPMAVVLIGAMIVGKIETVWGVVERSSSLLCRSYTGAASISLDKGAELGRFLLGSSAIVLMPKNTIQWLPNLQPQTAVQMGQGMAVLNLT